MSEGPGDAADLAERFESALYNIARGWRYATDRCLKYSGIGQEGWRTVAAPSHVFGDRGGTPAP
jgi:hypothetical protein